jgi:hypothetical protein
LEPFLVFFWVRSSLACDGGWVGAWVGARVGTARWAMYGM